MTEQVSTLKITQPDPLPKKGNLGENWNKWKQNFQIYVTASGISETDKTACALFLHIIGQYGRDIANELELLDIENISVQQLYEKFDKYCKPKSNLAFVRYQFFNSKQAKQSFDSFLLSLKQKSKTCEFDHLSDSLMTQIIAGISNKKLQERLFLMEELDLEKTVQECRAAELIESQVQQLPGGATPKKKPQQKNQKPNSKKNASKPKPSKKADDSPEKWVLL